MELAPDAPGIHGNYLFTLLFHPGYDARALKREHAEWNRRNAAPLRGAIATHDNELTLVRRDITTLMRCNKVHLFRRSWSGGSIGDPIVWGRCAKPPRDFERICRRFLHNCIWHSESGDQNLPQRRPICESAAQNSAFLYEKAPIIPPARARIPSRRDTFGNKWSASQVTANDKSAVFTNERGRLSAMRESYLNSKASAGGIFSASSA